MDPSAFPTGAGPVPVQLKGLKGHGKSMSSHDQSEQCASKPSGKGKGVPMIGKGAHQFQKTDLDDSKQRSSPTRRWNSKQGKSSHQCESGNYLEPDLSQQ